MHFLSAAIAAFVTGSLGQSLSSVVSANPNLSNLATILTKYPIIESHIGMAGGVTFLAPANGARGLNQLLQYINGPDEPKTPGRVEWTLSYHVMKGLLPSAAVPGDDFVETYVEEKFAKNFSSVTGGQRLHIVKENGTISLFSAFNARSNVTQTDIKFDGGIIHIIDGTLTLPQSPIVTAQTVGLTELAKNLKETGLVETIEALKDITIFAPTNTAFDTAFSALAALSPEKVAGVLNYHVVKGVGYSNGFKNDQVLPTVQGGNLTVEIRNGSMFVNSAKVIKTDFLTKNGVLHIIDSVLAS